MKKKMVLLYATYGSGHKAIANYINNYFNDHNNSYEILLIDVLDYAMPYLGRFSKWANETLMLKFPSLWNIVYQSSNYHLSGKISADISMNLFKNKQLEKLICDFNPDICLCTHFFGAELVKRYIKKGMIDPTIVNIITDYDPHQFWINHPRSKDYYVVGSNDVKQSILSLSKIEPDHIMPFGIPIHPVVPDNFNVIKAKKKYLIDNDNLTCVFFGGGGNGSLASLKYLKRLIKSNLPLNVIFITGKNEKCKKKADNLVEEYNADNVIVLGFCNNVPELLQLADFVITKPGGVQTTECIYFGKPMILINSSGGQENANYKYLVELDYAKKFKTVFFFNRYLKKICREPKIILSKRDNINENTAKESMQKLYGLVEEIIKDVK
ncbi:MAG: glycosyltransferase [Bacilli bacterium]|nr:glycosyltransferase [Bacilli bacterium]